MQAAKPDERAGDQQQPQDMCALLVGADEQGAALRAPRQRALHDPPARRKARLAGGWIQRLLTDAAQVWEVAMGRPCRLAPWRIVGRVQAQVVWPLRRGLGPVDDAGVQRRGQALGVVDGGARNDAHQRTTIRLDQHAALHSALAAIGRIAPSPRRSPPPSRALPIAPAAAGHSPSTPPTSAQAATSAPQRRAKPPRRT